MAGVRGPGYAALLTAFSTKLQYLTLIKCFRSSFHFPPNCDWSKLIELALYSPTKNTVHNFGFNRVIYGMDMIGGESRMNNDDNNNLVERVLVDHSSLGFLNVRARGNRSLIRTMERIPR